MIKIKMRTNMAGPKGTVSAGSIVSLPDGEAYLLINSGCAEFVSKEKEIETADFGPPAQKAVVEKKVTRKTRRGRSLENKDAKTEPRIGQPAD